MSEEDFSSSDSVRSAKELPYAQTFKFEGPFELERGDSLPEVTVVYETYGELNERRDNAILVCHALSGDSHVAAHDEDDDPGWWEAVVGPGKPIDTDRYFVVCPNVLGGCRGSTGPNSANPANGQPYGRDFPVVTVGDIVGVQARLVDHLGIDQLLAVVGGSLGGQMTIHWATQYPDRIAGAIAVATSPRLTSQGLAFDVIGRNAILRDPNFANGQYYGQESPTVGLAIARMLGHITYLSREAMTQKFDADRLRARHVPSEFETKFSVGSYLAYQGDRFVERFDANSYLTISMALDLFDMGETPEKLAESFAPSTCRWLVLSFSSDWLFPPFQSQQIVDALIANDKPVSYCNVQSDCGHDAFLLENEIAIYGEMMRAFLLNLEPSPPQSPHPDSVDPTESVHVLTSIFHRRHRLDYQTILELLPPDASVLDLGCGNGGLSYQLRQREHDRLMGVELDEWAILECIRRGLDVVQADLNQGLDNFADGQFDFVVLSRTLQTVTDVERVLAEMLRVGKRGIVTFPNLGFRQLRRQLAEDGRAPRVEAEEGFKWYNTPNVRFFTIADFDELCEDKGYTVHKRIALNTQQDRLIEDDPNTNADIAIAVLSR